MNRQRHIAVVCDYVLKPDRLGGMDRFFRAYNDALIKRGDRVTWFFAGKGKPGFYEGMEINLAGEFSVEESTINWLKKGGVFDIVVTHFVSLCTPFYKELKKRGIGYIIGVDHNPRPINGFPLKKRLRNRLKGWLYSEYIDTFVGVSQYTIDSLIKDFGNRINMRTVVVYNGIDTSIFRKRREFEGRSNFIVSSHLRKSKGIQDLIEAVKLMPGKIKNQIHIDVYGEGPMETELKKMVQKYKLGPVFYFKGSTTELPEILHHYCFLLQPTYMECFSLSILESLAANVPVITTPVGGNEEIIKNGENGFIFPAGDIDALGKLFSEVILGKKRIKKNVSLEIEENFTLQKMVSAHLQLLPLN